MKVDKNEKKYCKIEMLREQNNVERKKVNRHQEKYEKGKKEAK